jgi:hypothetical protein
MDSKQQTYSKVKESFQNMMGQAEGTKQALMDLYVEDQLKKNPGSSADFWRKKWLQKQGEPIKHKTQWEKDHPSADYSGSRNKDIPSSFNLLNPQQNQKE